MIQCRQAPQVVNAVWDEVEGSHFQWAEHSRSFEQLHDSLQQAINVAELFMEVGYGRRGTLLRLSSHLSLQGSIAVGESFVTASSSR